MSGGYLSGDDQSRNAVAQVVRSIWSIGFVSEILDRCVRESVHTPRLNSQQLAISNAQSAQQETKRNLAATRSQLTVPGLFPSKWFAS